MRASTFIFALAAPALLGGCVAKTAFDVATAPVRAASQAADWATTSQDEADRNRGREIRRREERLGRLERDYDKQVADCQDGHNRACNEARQTYAEIQMILPTIPVEAEEN